MELLTPILQAIGLFVATNIDDIIVLSLFYARGAGQRGTTRKILLGQYLGFGGILLAAVVISLGARSFLPEDALPYFGLIPLALGWMLLLASLNIARDRDWNAAVVVAIGFASIVVSYVLLATAIRTAQRRRELADEEVFS